MTDDTRTPEALTSDAAKLRTLATWFDKFDDWREATNKIAPGIAEYREVQSDLRRIADALAAHPVPDSGPDDTFWLIERGQAEGFDPPEYYTGTTEFGAILGGGVEHGWTTSVTEAMRFVGDAEKPKAERIAASLGVRVVQHGWFAARAALTTPEPTLDVETAEGWRWECAGCDRPVPPMGMCETCGVFGVMRLREAKS